MKLTHAVRATQGARSYQEDTAGVWLPAAGKETPGPAAEATRLLAILADGMGGHAGGAVASEAICKAFEACYADEKSGIPDRLRKGLEAGNLLVGHLVKEQPHLRGMGATLIGTAFDDVGVQWISVGDSPLYLYRRGELARLNEDHSMGPMLDRLVAAGRLSAEEARGDPRRHLLRSAVTGEEVDLIDTSARTLPLEAGDVVLLASDGVHTIEDDEIARIIAAYQKDGTEAVAAALIRAVEQVGEPHQDNTTVVVVGVEA